MTLKIERNFSLKKLNTFDIDVKADYFCKLNNFSEIDEVFRTTDILKNSFLIIGEGSNLLFTKDFAGWIVYPDFKGIEILNETDEFVSVKVYSGEKWDDFVAYCVENEFSGIENLSLIPGNVGAAPVQNIGAYGVEVKDVIEMVEYYDINQQKIFEISNFECKFAYRDSIFKNELKNDTIVISTTFRLNKKHSFKTEYQGIAEELKKIGEINLKNIRKAVIEIRNRKLPKVGEIGSAGSFFKNPVIDKQLFHKVVSENPEIPFFDLKNNSYKIPAAWLIEKSNYKGFRTGDVGVYEKHALILVNYGNAKGVEIWNLALKIINDVKLKFGILLEPEVIVI